MFQFLIGRLRTSEWNSDGTFEFKFQFLIGRLRTNFPPVKRGFSVVKERHENLKYMFSILANLLVMSIIFVNNQFQSSFWNFCTIVGRRKILDENFLSSFFHSH